MAKSRYTTLVLSGESLCGMATVGACQSLKECNMLDSVTTVIGVSSGAVIGALLAAGLAPLDIYNQFIRENMHLLLQPAFSFETLFNHRSLIDFRPIEDNLKKMLQDGVAKSSVQRRLQVEDSPPTFAGLERCTGVSFVTLAYNLSKRTMEVFDSTRTPDVSIHEAVKASCSLPLLFPRCVWRNGDTYVDGGMVNNLPVDLSADPRHTLAVCLNKTRDIATWLAYIVDSIRVSVNHRTRESALTAERCGATIIAIPVQDTIPVGMETHVNFFDAGYTYVRDWVERRERV